MSENVGKVVQIIGPVIDIKFAENCLPDINHAVRIAAEDREVTTEVIQHLGNNTVRCISMDATEGLVRGARAVDTGAAITVPVGPAV
ncbi:MAG: F0F1 ATP synthase subunit beta, partial [Lachnospiraceae bacterium]|nr:F0F1 ATP synthase subunit beta [Lachnospiraceae bacterium]